METAKDTSKDSSVYMYPTKLHYAAPSAIPVSYHTVVPSVYSDVVEGHVSTPNSTVPDAASVSSSGVSSTGDSTVPSGDSSTGSTAMDVEVNGEPVKPADDGTVSNTVPSTVDTGVSSGIAAVPNTTVPSTAQKPVSTVPSIVPNGAITCTQTTVLRPSSNALSRWPGSLFYPQPSTITYPDLGGTNCISTANNHTFNTFNTLPHANVNPGSSGSSLPTLTARMFSPYEVLHRRMQQFYTLPNTVDTTVPVTVESTADHSTSEATTTGGTIGSDAGNVEMTIVA